MRKFAFVPVFLLLLGATGCGYHSLGSATHMPADVHTLAVPVFATRTEAYHTEVVMTEAVINTSSRVRRIKP